MEAQTKYGIGDKVYFLKFEEKDKKPIMGNVTIHEGTIKKIFIEHIERPNYDENFMDGDPEMVPHTEVGYTVHDMNKIFVEEKYVSDSINGLMELLFTRSNRNHRYKLEKNDERNI